MKNKKGITLIALIITIIVLLILAGVSISMVVGENGILNRATEASKKTNEAKDEEQRQFAMAEAAMNFENTTYVDPNTKEEITIPAGFAVSQVEGENTVEDGLVIIDSNGNEFVWIPVDITEFKRVEGYGHGKKSEILDRCNEPYNTGYATEKAEYEAMKLSVETNGGFYIGRYEAGKDTNGNVVVQKGVDVYNNIKWGKAMNDPTGEGAVQKSKEFKKRKSI